MDYRGMIRAQMKWPRRKLGAAFLIVVFMIGGVLLGYNSVTSPPTCGGQVMKPGDRCVNLRSGSSASSAQVASAPHRSVGFWVIFELALLGGLVYCLRHREPTPADLTRFSDANAAGRADLERRLTTLGAAPDTVAPVLDRYDAATARELGPDLMVAVEQIRNRNTSRTNRLPQTAPQPPAADPQPPEAEQPPSIT